MRKTRNLLAAAFLVFVAIGTLYALGRIGRYRVGQNIAVHDLDPRAGYGRYVWAPSSYETLPEYCKRTICHEETFTGVLQLNAPRTEDHGTTLSVKGGRVEPQYVQGLGESVKQDYTTGRRKNVAEMLKATQNDWRILIHEDSAVVPAKGAFTGTIFIPPVNLGTEIVLEVEEDRIVAVSRRFYFD